MTTTNGHQVQPLPGAPPSLRRRTPWALVVVATLFVIVPFITWYGTWFGRTLTDADIETYLHDEANPRHEQHALAQIDERLRRGDARVRRWYAQVAALGHSQYTDVRMTAAWVMGRDPAAAEFNAALLKLLADDEPIVRRNAALALVNNNDARARPELLAMLNAYEFKAPIGGQVETVLPVGTPLRREAMVARVRTAAGQLAEVRAPLPGRIEQVAVTQGAALEPGALLVTLAPDEASLLSALVGLRFVGTQADLAEVERFAQGGAGVPEGLKKEAARTAEAIKSRTSQAQRAPAS